jgi:hypothetical protein
MQKEDVKGLMLYAGEEARCELVVALMCIVVFWGCGSQRRKDTREI